MRDSREEIRSARNASSAIIRHHATVEKILKAHGILEWRSINNAPRITYLRYAFGKPPSPGVTAHSGLEWTLDYDLQAGSSIPKRVVWLDRKSRTTSEISPLSTAETDLNYYSPMAFGLDRPRSPWPKWVYLLAAALAFAGVALAVRHQRSRDS